MGKNSLDRKIVLTDQLDDVRFNLFDTGLLDIVSPLSGPITKFTNASSLRDTGHLEKLMSACAETVKLFRSGGGSSPALRNNVFEFNEIRNGETVRAILDETTFSAPTKFITVLSYLTVCPSLDFPTVKRFADRQVKLEDLSSFINIDFASFLLPDFADQSSRTNFIHTGRKLESYENMLTYLGAFVEGDPNETISQYKDRIAETPFTPVTNSKLLIDASSTASVLLEYKSKLFQELTKELTIRETIRFLNMYKDVGVPKFFEFIIERSKSDSVTFYEQVNGSTEDLKSYSKFNGLARFLTRSETYKLGKFMKTNYPEVWESTSFDFYAFAAFYISYAFIQRGTQGVSELIYFLQSSTSEKSTDHLYYDLNYQMTISYFFHSGLMEALDSEYRDMPIGWAINLVKGKREKAPERISANV